MEVPNLTEISLPIESTNQEIIQRLKNKIYSGEYTIGELIVPQTFEKVSIMNNKLEKQEIMVEERKIPFDKIRTDLNKKQSKYMRIKTDDELSSLNRDDIIADLKRINEFHPNYELFTTTSAKIKVI